jgi:hypothetical protein
MSPTGAVIVGQQRGRAVARMAARDGDGVAASIGSRPAAAVHMGVDETRSSTAARPARLPAMQRRAAARPRCGRRQSPGGR